MRRKLFLISVTILFVLLIGCGSQYNDENHKNKTYVTFFSGGEVVAEFETYECYGKQGWVRIVLPDGNVVGWSGEYLFSEVPTETYGQKVSFMGG